MTYYKKMSKVGQLDFPIATLMIFVFGLLIFAPMALKVFRSIQTPISDGLANVSYGGDIASQNFNSVMNPLISFWDEVIIFAFILSIILMIVSSFMIDTHPVWIILYIVVWFILIVFAPNIVSAATAIYDSSQFAGEVALLPLTNALRLHFVEYMVGLGLLSGIIIFGKIGFGGGLGNGSNGGNR
jgi:hypothetical protein